MDIDKLTASGLSEQQAKTYSLLLNSGSITPPDAARLLNMTRSNAYKILDRLVEMGLAERKDIRKKLTYTPTNPSALVELSAKQRAEAVARENAVKNIMQELLGKYYSHTDKPDIATHTGQDETMIAYRKQLALQEDIYFIHTPVDVPLMGFDVMHEIRTAPARYGCKRYGILSAPPDNRPINYESHKRTNLEITWTTKKLYDAPVEWSATKSTLLIVSYAAIPQAIFISSPIIGSAFIQLWKMMDHLLKPTSLHQSAEQK
jgi:DNA-binding MarR family transcriptional regulator